MSDFEHQLGKIKEESCEMGYATLSRSRTYIMVPRDVPPENFVTVQETRKVERVGLARCLLPPCLVVGCLCFEAALLLRQPPHEAPKPHALVPHNSKAAQAQSTSGRICPDSHIKSAVVPMMATNSTLPPPPPCRQFSDSS